MVIDKLIAAPGRLTVSGAPEGEDARLVGGSRRADWPPSGRAVLHIARDDLRMTAISDALRFFAPLVEVVAIPAWDCLPYDRTSPNRTVSADRMNALGILASDKPVPGHGRVVVTTVNAALQRVPPRSMVQDAVFRRSIGDKLDLDELTAYLAADGYARAGTVSEEGEYAMRGGILDIFPPGQPEPLRLDLFGDVLDGVRTFDPASQRTTGKREGFALIPASEMMLDEDSIRRFRSGYVALFGAVADEDPLYEAVSAGRRYQGMEHWLPLFHETLETLFDYVPDALVTLDALAEESQGRAACHHRRLLRDAADGLGRRRGMDAALQAAAAGPALSLRRRLDQGDRPRPHLHAVPRAGVRYRASMPAPSRAAISPPNARRATGRSSTR